jgi:hypothetical protein
MGYSEEKFREREYDMSRYKRTKRFRQILVVVSLISLSSSLLFGTAKVIGNSLKQQEGDPNAEVSSVQLQLAARARGYELVLQREPENKTALEGLANVRLEMDDRQGAIQVLEKLVKLEDDRADYREKLAQLKEEVDAEGDVSR